MLKLNQISVNATNNDQATPLTFACLDGGRLDKMETLIQYGADINVRFNDGSTLLHYASRYSKQDIIEFLLKLNQISVNATNNNQATPLMFACSNGGHLDNMETLIQYGADINARDIDGKTLLHYASRYSKQEIVEFLLKLNQISINATNNNQATPLAFACLDGGHLDNMKTLLQYGADINVRFNDGSTLLHYASRYSKQDIVEFLLKLNQISVNATNNNQATPLMFACFDGGHLDNMETLIQYGADINARDIDGSTLLHYASRYSKQEIVEFLLKLNLVSVNATNNNQATPLMFACSNGGHLDNMKMLIQYGADINVRFNDGSTLLHYASQYSRQDIVEFLLKLNQISVNATNNDQATPLTFACLDGGRLDNMEMLIQYGADINVRFNDGSTLLHYASRYSKQDIVEFLLKLNQISVNATNNNQATPLMFACFDGGHLDNMETLIQYGADINARDIDGSTLLHYASRYSKQEIVEFLLKLNLVSVNATNNNQATPLMFACSNGGHLDNMKTLIQYGADINVRFNDGSTLLHYASQYSRQDIVEFLLKLNQILVNATNNDQATPLTFACLDGGRLDNMEMLIQYGADINVRFNDGSTLLHYASRYSKQEIVEFLLKLNLVSVNATNNNQATPLMFACSNGGGLDNMKTLILYGVDINVRFNDGSTLLHYASQYSRQDIVEFLLKLNQISINATNNDQATPLTFACLDGGRLDNMETLLKFGADINARDIDGSTLLHYASRHSKQDIVEFLLKLNHISVNAINNNQATPLMFACFDGGRLDNMETLLQFGADINVRFNDGSTLLHCASRYSKQDIVEFLLKLNQISVNATNNNQATPLMFACFDGGHLDNMETLIQYGADINARDIDGSTLLHYASRYSKQEIVEFLLKLNLVSVNATNNNQATPLMFACSNGGGLDNMKTLIQYGADINVRFNDGSTLLHYASQYSRQDIVEFLLKLNQILVNATNNDQATPLTFACLDGGRLDNMEMLIQYGADINVRFNDGSTLLHYASRYSKQDIVEFLLKLNLVSVNATNNNQATPLMFACLDGGRLDNMETLLKFGADINARDIDGSTLLHYASRYAKQEIVESSLKLNQISINATSRNQATPLMFVFAYGGGLDNMKTLIQYGADINARDIDGKTLLHYASRYSKQEIVEFLLKLNQISINATNNNQATPLMFACFDGGHLDNMETLIQYGADINVRFNDGSTLLHYASRYSKQDIIEFLLKLNQISVNATNNNQATPLMFACSNGDHLDNMETLIQYGADINARDIDGKTLLHYASRYSKQEIVESLLKLNQISINATSRNQATPLMFVFAYGGGLDNMKTLIQYGADINVSFNDGSTLLHYASRYSKQDVVESSLKLNQISINAINNNQATPLMFACSNGGHLDNMETLIQYGADINARDIDGKTLLHYASRYSKQEIVEFLLKLNQISVNATNNNQATLLAFACLDGGHLDNMKTLLQYGADINVRFNDGSTLLHCASRYSKQDIVEFLLKLNQISVNATNNNQATPLMFACFDGGHLDNMETLIQYGADINARDIDGSTLLHYASRYSKQEIVEFLLKLNLVSVNATNNNQATPLMFACSNGGGVDNMKTLIQYGADINVRFNDGSTLLHYASRYSKQDIIEFLLKLNQISVNATNNNQATPLMFACSNGDHLDNMETLIQYGADINARDIDGKTLLHYASRYSKQEIVESLLKLNQISINATSRNQATPLMFVFAYGGGLDNMKTLIQYGADINVSFNNGSTLLHYASRYSKQEIVESLLKLNQISVNATNNNQATPLMFACSNGGHLDNMETLIQYGADINARDIDGETLLHYASRYSKQEIVEFLLKLNQISINATNNNQATPLMFACFDGGHLDNMETLIQYGADINVRFNDGSTLLHYASRYSKQDIIEFLLKLNQISVNATNNNQATPLMFACSNGDHLDNMETLIQYGADINARDIDGKTLLHYASRYSKQDIIEFLLKLNQISVNATNNNQATPLAFACLDGGHLDNMKTLLQYGADINVRFNDGSTLLHYASRYSKQDIVEFLLKLNQISVNATNNNQATPLMFACLDGGHLDNMETLIQYGADINARDIDGKTLLHYASRYSKQDIIEFLLKLNQISVNATNNNQATPLAFACLDGGHLDNMKTLLQYGADINVRFNDGSTLLHYASRYSKQDVVEFLLKLNQISVNATNNNQATPLMFACFDGGHLDNMETLIQYGADINARDIDGKTLLHYASRYSKQDIIEFLLKLNQISVNATNNNQATPLAFACLDGGHLDNMKTLLQYGADINVRFKDGSTLLHYASRYSKQDIVEFLLKLNQISVNATNNNQATPLMFACFDGGHLDNMETLIQYGADINARDIDGKTLLHYASRYSKQDIIEFLLKLNQISVNATNNNQATPLAFACLDGGHLDNMKTLLQYGADINVRFKDGSTLLHYASRYSKQDIVEFLLKLNQISVNATCNNQRTPVMFACLDGGRLDNMEMLIQYGADINARDINGKTLLHYASRYSKQEIVKFLLKSNQISINATDNDQATPLMFACFNGGRLDNMKTLIYFGADINMKTLNDMWNVFHCACALAKLDIVEFLVDVYTLELKAMVVKTVRPTAKLCRNHLQLLSNFQGKDGDINLFSSIIAASGNISRCEVCVILLSSPINEIDDIGMTPLMLACERNHLEIVSFLINCGLVVNTHTSHKYTAVHVAARYGNIDLLEVLVNDIIEINSSDEFGLTPLFWACRGNNLDAVKFLISRGACVNIKSRESWNLLHMAVICAGMEIIEYFLECKVSINDVDNRNRSPLSLAYEIKREDAIKVLLLNGALLRPNDISLVGTALYSSSTVYENSETLLTTPNYNENVKCSEEINPEYLRPLHSPIKPFASNL